MLLADVAALELPKDSQIHFPVKLDKFCCISLQFMVHCYFISTIITLKNSQIPCYISLRTSKKSLFEICNSISGANLYHWLICVIRLWMIFSKILLALRRIRDLLSNLFNWYHAVAYGFHESLIKSKNGYEIMNEACTMTSSKTNSWT